MITDRPTVPPRTNAMPERSYALGRPQGAPADAFAALLGVASPAANEVPRREDATRADRPRHDRGGCSKPLRPAGEEPTLESDVPVEATTTPTVEPTPEAPATPLTPELFALQLASPLPPAPTAPVAPQADGEAPVLPAFAPATSPVALTPAAPTAPEAAVTPTEPTTTAPTLPVLPNLIPASALAAEPTTEVPVAQPAAPAAPIALPAEAAVPAEEAAVALPNGAFGQSGSDAQPEEQPAATPAPAAAPAQAKPAEAPAAPSAPQPVAQAAPVAPATPLAPTSGLERAVPLYRAVETTRTLLHVAAERGVTHARLNLKPVELGGIEVRLQSTPLGISAQLVADSPEAARMLSQASEDLRRQLAERDVTLLSLDVSTSSEQRHQANAGGADGFDDSYRPGGQANGRPAGDGPADAPKPAETTLVLPDGVLVDVLA